MFRYVVLFCFIKVRCRPFKRITFVSDAVIGCCKRVDRQPFKPDEPSIFWIGDQKFLTEEVEHIVEQTATPERNTGRHRLRCADQRVFVGDGEEEVCLGQ
ncbi:hypothetical protein D3C71_1633360 [compost metagenome]